MERILIGIDPEAASDVAVEWAIERGRRHEVELHAVSVVDLLLWDSTPLEERLAQLRERIASALPRARVTTALVDGPVVETLAAESERADLVAVGYHRRRPVRSILAGALPVRIAARSHCPTVVVPEDGGPRKGPVVVGVADDASSEAAVEFAVREALAADAELLVVHAWSLPNPSMDTVADLVGRAELIRRNHRDLLDELVARLRLAHPRLRLRPELVEAPGAVALERAAADARLLVVGTHRRGPVSGLILGSTLLDVLPFSPAPVCIVPAAAPLTPGRR